MTAETPEFTPFHEDSKRDALRAKIEAGERRIEERTLASDAREAAHAAADYARGNPGKVIGGALALGLLIGLLTAPGRRAAANAAARVTSKKPKKKLKSAQDNASKFSTMLTSALMTQGLQLLDEVLERTHEGRERLDDFAGKAVSNVQRLGHEAAETSSDLASRTRKRAEIAARDIADRLKV
jgi:hypothetical protein